MTSLPSLPTATRPIIRPLYRVVYTAPDTSGHHVRRSLAEARSVAANLDALGWFDWYIISEHGEIIEKGVHRIPWEGGEQG